MDVLLQHHGAKRIYPVPEGLKELCTDISREVLRSQPSNILGFIAEYLEALLISRDNARVVARILSEILDESVSYESAWKRRGLTMEEVTNAAIIIQAAYRGFITRRTLRALPSDGMKPANMEELKMWIRKVCREIQSAVIENVQQ